MMMVGNTPPVTTKTARRRCRGNEEKELCIVIACAIFGSRLDCAYSVLTGISARYIHRHERVHNNFRMMYQVVLTRFFRFSFFNILLYFTTFLTVLSKFEQKKLLFMKILNF